jgi:hypothetical protein
MKRNKRENKIIRLVFLTNISGSVVETGRIVELTFDLIGQLSGHGYSVHSSHVRVESLPLGHPAVVRVHQCDHAVKVGARAVMHFVPVAFEAQQIVAVIASFFVKLVQCLLSIPSSVQFSSVGD